VGSSKSGSNSLRGKKYWSTISWDTFSRVGGSHWIYLIDNQSMNLDFKYSFLILEKIRM
jgi:hypothetical protein